MIEMKCPHCGHQLRISSRYAGKWGGCKHCRGKFVVPEAAAPPSPPEQQVSTSLSGLRKASGVPPSGQSPSGPFAENAEATSLESLRAEGDFDTSDDSAIGDIFSNVSPGQSLGQFAGLGCFFWGLAFFVPPAAIVWAIFIPREHPNKRSALAVPIVLTLSMIVLFAGMLSLSDRIRAMSPWSIFEEIRVADEQDQSISTVAGGRVVLDEPGLNIIAYDAGPYDMTAITLYVEATLDVFPVRDYPSIKQLANVYKTARRSPTRENGEALEEAFANFGDNLSDADEEKGLEVLDKVIDAGMEQSADMTAEERSNGAVQLMITAWADSIEQSHQYLSGEKGDVISEAAFDRLEGEMSYDEVSAIIGREGDCPMRSSSTVDGARTTSAQCAWSWELKPGVIASIHACFLNDELRVKAYSEVPE